MLQWQILPDRQAPALLYSKNTPAPQTTARRRNSGGAARFPRKPCPVIPRLFRRFHPLGAIPARHRRKLPRSRCHPKRHKQILKSRAAFLRHPQRGVRCRPARPVPRPRVPPPRPFRLPDRITRNAATCQARKGRDAAAAAGAQTTRNPNARLQNAAALRNPFRAPARKSTALQPNARAKPMRTPTRPRPRNPRPSRHRAGPPEKKAKKSAPRLTEKACRVTMPRQRSYPAARQVISITDNLRFAPRRA